MAEDCLEEKKGEIVRSEMKKEVPKSQKNWGRALDFSVGSLEK